MKTQRTVREGLRELRAVVDDSPDPYEQRVAYAMETAIRWAREQTVGWPSPASEAKAIARLLRDETRPR